MHSIIKNNHDTFIDIVQMVSKIPSTSQSIPFHQTIKPG